MDKNAEVISDDSYYIKHGRTLFYLCWFAYAVSYIGRYNYSACMTSMIESGVISESFGGVISACFLVCYGSGQLINGLLGDKISPKYMIFMGLLGSGLANCLMTFSVTPLYVCVIWCVNGYSCSMLWSPLIRCFAEYLLVKQRMMAAVNISTTIPAGSLLSYAFSAMLLKTESWKNVFAVCGLVLVISSIIWFVKMNSASMKEYLSNIVEKKKTIGEGNLAAERERGSHGSFGILLATGAVFTVIAVICNGMLKESVTQFVPKFLYDVFSVDGSVASAVSMLLPVVNVFGAYAASFFLRRIFKNELLTAAFLFGISTVSSVLLYTAGRYSIIAAALLVAVTTSVMLGVNTLLLTFIPLCYSRVGLSSSFTGFLDAFAYLASAVAAVVFGNVSSGSLGWNGVLAMWVLIGAAGVIVCLVGTPVWRKGKSSLSDDSLTLSIAHKS